MGTRITGQQRDFENCPIGRWPAVLVDVIDMGEMQNSAGEWRQKIKLIWEIEAFFPDGRPARTEDGKPYTVNALYTASLYSGAFLREPVEAMLERELTEEETNDFELADLIDSPCVVEVDHYHNPKKNRTYDNVKSVSRCYQNDKRIKPSGKYVRREEQPTQGGRGTRQQSDVRRANEHYARPSSPPPGHPAAEATPNTNHSGASRSFDEAKSRTTPQSATSAQKQNQDKYKELLIIARFARSGEELDRLRPLCLLAKKEGLINHQQLLDLSQASTTRREELRQEAERAAAQKAQQPGEDLDDDIPF